MAGGSLRSKPHPDILAFQGEADRSDTQARRHGGLMVAHANTLPGSHPAPVQAQHASASSGIRESVPSSASGTRYFPVRPQQNTRPAAKMIGVVLVLVGIGLAALSLLADWLDFGGGEGFGYQQLIVLIVGIVLILGGLRIVAQSVLNRLNGPPETGDYDRHGDQRRA